MAAGMKWFEALRFRRRQLDLTQQDLAKIAKVDRAIIANIEAGRRKLSDDWIAEDLWEALRRIAKERGLKFVGKELRKITPAEQLAAPQPSQYVTGNLAPWLLASFRPKKNIHQFLMEQFEKIAKENAERTRQLAALKNLPGALDDSIVVELIESLRVEIEQKDAMLAQKDDHIAALEAALKDD